MTDDRPEAAEGGSPNKRPETIAESYARWQRWSDSLMPGALKAAKRDPTVAAQLRGAFAEQLRTMAELGIKYPAEWDRLVKPAGLH